MTRKLSFSRLCRACLISPNLTGTMCLTAPRLVLGSPFHYSPCDCISGSCLWCLGKHDYSQHAVFSRLWSLGCYRWRWIRGIQPCRCSIIHGSTWVQHGRIRTHVNRFDADVLFAFPRMMACRKMTTSYLWLGRSRSTSTQGPSSAIPQQECPSSR